MHISNIQPVFLSPTQRVHCAKFVLEEAIKAEAKGETLFSVDHRILNSKGINNYELPSSVFVKLNPNRFPLAEYVSKHLSPIITLQRRPKLTGLQRTNGDIDSSDYLTIFHPFLFKIVSTFFKGKKGKKLIDVLPLLILQLKGFHFLELYSTVNYLLRKKGSLKGVTTSVIKLLDNINFTAINGKWTDYYSDFDMVKVLNSNSSDWKKDFSGERAIGIGEILLKLKDEGLNSVVDIAANQGYFSILANRLGMEVTSIDYDIASIDLLSNNIHSSTKNINITPLVVNFNMLPENLAKEIKSDIGMALGFTHHLWYVENYSWNDISFALQKLSEKALITEFKPNTKGRSSKAFSKEKDETYSLDAFTDSLKNYFSDVSQVGTFKAEGSEADRILLLCRR